MSFFDRRDVHLSRLRNNKHHSIYLQNAFNKYGESIFIFSILEEVSNPKLLIQKEQFHLDALKCYDREYGYNICKVAGSQLGNRHSEESKRKIRESCRGMGSGRKLSSETKHKLSVAKLGKSPTITEKFRRGIISSAITRTKLSKEQIRIIQSTPYVFGIQAQFARQFNVSKQTISRVVKGNGELYK